MNLIPSADDDRAMGGCDNFLSVIVMLILFSNNRTERKSTCGASSWSGLSTFELPLGFTVDVIDFNFENFCSLVFLLNI